jgi:acetolactate synthase-1/2/3 large subunit
MHTIGQPADEQIGSGTETRIAAYQLTDYLERLGVEVVFGLCGHTVIALLDALGKSRIRFVSTRHEQTAAHAADGYARVTGKPGVLLTHLGPGLTNAATGVANAALDSIPMVVIAGDVQSYFHGRHPHQGVNLPRSLGHQLRLPQRQLVPAGTVTSSPTGRTRV